MPWEVGFWLKTERLFAYVTETFAMKYFISQFCNVLQFFQKLLLWKLFLLLLWCFAMTLVRRRTWAIWFQTFANLTSRLRNSVNFQLIFTNDISKPKFRFTRSNKITWFLDLTVLKVELCFSTFLLGRPVYQHWLCRDSHSQCSNVCTNFPHTRLYLPFYSYFHCLSVIGAESLRKDWQGNKGKEGVKIDGSAYRVECQLLSK